MSLFGASFQLSSARIVLHNWFRTGRLADGLAQIYHSACRGQQPEPNQRTSNVNKIPPELKQSIFNQFSHRIITDKMLPVAVNIELAKILEDTKRTNQSNQIDR